MNPDPIVAEFRQSRRRHAAAFGNDLAAIVEDLRRIERESNLETVSFPPRRPGAAATAPRAANDES